MEELKTEDITNQIKNIIRSAKPSFKVDNIKEEGVVLQVGDGISRVAGLEGAGSMEVLEFAGGVYGLAFSLEKDGVGCILLGAEEKIKEGSRVTCTGHLLEIPVGKEMIGRIVNPLGMPIDGKGKIKTDKFRLVERIAPGVIARQPVTEAVQTGIKAIDAMIPIGRGQRELIIGDRKIGKTTIAIDTIINQKNSDIICIYCAIGQKAASVAKVVEILRKEGALDHTIIVAALANEQTAFRYLSPYAACAIGEEFMEQGKHALVIYDDLSKHAVAYREMSALLKRPIGREAYPGDIFYVHSRLLERAARLSDEKGGGSLTALPIIETLGGDVTSYISTNVISITDGQIYLENGLFNTGFRPAITVGLSVSRVGGAAQTKIMKKVAGRLRIDLAQYHEMEAFVKFGAEVDAATKTQLARGERGRELLKQAQYAPMPLAEEIVVLYAVVNSMMDEIPINRIKEFEKGLVEFANQNYRKIMELINEKKELTPEIEAGLKEIAGEYRKVFV
ncbi:F0F1 ATP synthase subunit alpha [Candidatus Falkowbacteria bacterium RBG_13_39_14]|uniref:ATP synthase subunit alpha n=1 Tax=Candidatus Falkowbacteria bacterium RBG_13_39_14 TaxID=1797985 RepID=A0A1F5S1U2_9BACT|nr:MAG: F0F1 ATP synthase subunit alpha [Candidatus Falkowbacteria bacterium RBG_13_39_14]